MKTIILIAALVAAACAARIPSDAEVQSHWANFKATHAKEYASEAEEAYRMKIFKENLIRIAQHNEQYEKGEVSFRVGLKHFADMHTHEVAEKLNGFRMENARKSGRVHKASLTSSSTPKTVDWRKEGYVTAVKDQGQCGSCWSFSATGSLEGQLFKKTGKLVALSEQNLIDCSSTSRYNNAGCNGGLMDAAFQYVSDNKGINTEAFYPYKGYQGRCRYSKANNAGTNTGFVDVNATERDLEDAVEKVGPVSVAIDASQWSFQYYESGVYYERSCSSDELDHGVLAVGFGTENGQDYWLVKNSWGTSWGEAGYIKMIRNKNNNCGIASMASYPTV